MKTYRSTQTSLFVGRQADQVDGEIYETVEVPTPKDELIEFLNTLTPTEKVDVNPIEVEVAPTPPMLNPTDALYAKVRQDVVQGNVDLEHVLWNAPLDMCLRLGGIVLERTREHFAKEQKDVRTKASAPVGVEQAGTTG